jgi:hypothetical protein
VDAQISHSLSYISWQAAVAAGLDLYKWWRGEYPVRFQAKVIAWYQLRNLVRLHQEQAVADRQKREIKKGRKR